MCVTPSESLCGHAGEEIITKESFLSIAWRLIPYWLSRWESQWGAECSSMLFELPHYALELLVVLPLVQVRAAQTCVSCQTGTLDFSQRAVAVGRTLSSRAVTAANDMQIICLRILAICQGPAACRQAA